MKKKNVNPQTISVRFFFSFFLNCCVLFSYFSLSLFNFVFLITKKKLFCGRDHTRVGTER